MANKLYQKILLITVLASITLAPISSSFKINMANAVLGVADATFVNLTTVSDPVTLGYYSLSLDAQGVTGDLNTATDRILKFALKMAGQIFKKVILDRLVDALTAYISGQKDTIIDNWDQFFQQAGEDAAGLVAQQINVLGVNVCNNFNLNLRFMLLPVKSFSQNVTCSLNQIIGNIDSFLNNFENGSWVAYQEQWYPNNNFYGTAITALDEAALQSARAKDAAQSQGLAGQGFFSKEVCDKGPNGEKTNKNCHIVTPGSWTAEQVNKWIGPGKDFLTIIGADDIAAYMGAIVNAGVNRLSIMALGDQGLQGLFKKDTKSLTTTTPKAPCAGLSGDAFRACANFQSISNSGYRANQVGAQNLLNSTLQTRKEADSILSQLIASQTELVDSLSALAACKAGNASTASQLSEEQSTLDNLQNKFDDNKTFLTPLEQSSEKINGLENGDWTNLGTQVANNLALSDPKAAADLLSDIKNERQQINNNINSKLPGIKLQLQQCPQKIKPAS